MRRLKKGVKYTLMSIGATCLLLSLLIACSLAFFPESAFSTRVLSFFTPAKVEPSLPQDIYSAFRVTLQSEVKREMGTPTGGFEPYMFLEIFPGLTETDFEGAEASIGFYTVEDGRLIHMLDDSKLIHNAAKALTDRGMDTLLRNVSNRLKVDLAQGGTLTKIMDALVSEAKNGEPVLQEPVACTMDAKICPDGSAVGRTGPDCNFAPCP